MPLLKWIYLFQNSSQSRTRYLTSMISYLISQLVRLGGVMIIWYVTLRNSANIDFKEIFTYYLLGEIFIVQLSHHSLIEGEIVSGKLANRLLRPANLWLSYWIDYIGRYFVVDTIKVLIGIIVGIIGFQFLVMPASILYFVFFLISSIIAYLINLYIGYIIGFCSFYFGYIFGVAELVTQVKTIISGQMLPLNYLPFAAILQNLPFALTFFIPLQIYLGKISYQESIISILTGVFWVIILFIIAKVIYTKGLQKFEATGL